MSDARRCRIVMQPVSPASGQPRHDAPVIVYTAPCRRLRSLWMRLCWLNGGKWPVISHDGFCRYQVTWMTEDYYQAHRPQGAVLYRNRADRIVEAGA